MVYYQQQSIALLGQISKQVSVITPQVSIPSAPPPPYPDFSPKSSDVRVNAFWFMSLVFSLSAALLATLIQQWVRDYMHVFQRYSNPLKSARLRQYLYEGAEGWYMPVVAESVPGFVHVSLFLFFVGLGDLLFAINTTVGVTTTAPIAICGLLYVLSMFAPVIEPQSPFQNPFSGLIWYLKQKVHPRRYLDRASGGSLKAVSSNMSAGQLQLAMEENDERKGRDVRAIQWLIDNRTEDDEMESFATAIPGAFTSKWGVEVWRKVSEIQHYEDVHSGLNDPPIGSQTDADLYMSIPPPHHHSRLSLRTTCHPRGLLHPLGLIGIRTTTHLTATQSIPPLPSGADSPHVTGDLAICDLCTRVRHLLETCDNRSLFPNEELWRKRARGCVETVASLVFCAGLKQGLFGDLGRLLCELAKVEKIRALTAAGSAGSFITRWTCLSLVVVTRGISNDDRLKVDARLAVNYFSQFRMEADDEHIVSGGVNEKALKNARRIDDYFEDAKLFCVSGLRRAFKPWEGGLGRTEAGRTPEELVKNILARDYEVDISTLERRPVTDPSMGCRLREDLDRGTGTIGLKNGGQRRSEFSDRGIFLKTSVYRRMYKLG
jgi:hypothetical protein